MAKRTKTRRKNQKRTRKTGGGPKKYGKTKTAKIEAAILEAKVTNPRNQTLDYWESKQLYRNETKRPLQPGVQPRFFNTLFASFIRVDLKDIYSECQLIMSAFSNFEASQLTHTIVNDVDVTPEFTMVLYLFVRIMPVISHFCKLVCKQLVPGENLKIMVVPNNTSRTQFSTLKVQREFAYQLVQIIKYLIEDRTMMNAEKIRLVTSYSNFNEQPIGLHLTDFAQQTVQEHPGALSGHNIAENVSIFHNDADTITEDSCVRLEIVKPVIDSPGTFREVPLFEVGYGFNYLNEAEQQNYMQAIPLGIKDRDTDRDIELLVKRKQNVK